MSNKGLIGEKERESLKISVKKRCCALRLQYKRTAGGVGTARVPKKSFFCILIVMVEYPGRSKFPIRLYIMP